MTDTSAETLFAELKRYVVFDAADTARIRDLRPHVAPQFERIVRAFYDRTRAHEQAHAVFADEAQIARLQRSLITWLDRVFLGPHDEAFFERTLRIGRVHAVIELPQRYMLAAMAFVRTELATLLDDVALAERQASMHSLHKLLDLELAGMLESYNTDLRARLEQQRRATYDALLRMEHRYVNAVEVANVLVVGLDTAQRIRFVNREAENVTGRTRHDLLGTVFADSLDTEGLVTEAAAEVASGKRPSGTAADGVVRNRAGKLRDIRWQLARAPSEEDEVVLFAIGSDVTEERLQAARLQKDQKLAAVGTLAAGLAHEIRNPLNGAQLHVTFLERALRKRGDMPDELEAVGVVGDEIKRLALLVNEFLDFARPRPLALRPVDVNALANRVLYLVSAKAAAAEAEVSLDLPVTELAIQADAGKLEQVLLNLLHNAIEAVQSSSGGKVVLRARLKPRAVLFEVEDDGPGLQSPDAPIFDAFYSTKAQGTGLGLSISHRIVTDHGGVMSVETRPGQTIFRFTVPLSPGT